VLNTQLRHWGLPVPDSTNELVEAYEQVYFIRTYLGQINFCQCLRRGVRKLPESSYKDLEIHGGQTDYIRNAAKITTSSSERTWVPLRGQ